MVEGYLLLWARLLLSWFTLTWGEKVTKVSVSFAFPLLILSYRLKAAKVKVKDKTNLQESTS